MASFRAVFVKSYPRFNFPEYDTQIAFWKFQGCSLEKKDREKVYKEMEKLGKGNIEQEEKNGESRSRFVERKAHA